MQIPTLKITEIDGFLPKKRKNVEDFGPLIFEENDIDSEITLKVKIEESDLDDIIYFLDNTEGEYDTTEEDVEHYHDNLDELNEKNTLLIIDGKTVTYEKYFIPKKTGIYSIKLLFKIKLSNCAFMFCECHNIIDIDFSKFKTENVTDMKYMFFNYSGL